MKLIIDAVYKNLDLAIIDDKNTIISVTRTIQKKNLSEILVQEIESILLKSKINKNGIKQLYIVNGPGSFTSLKMISIFANIWKQERLVQLYIINTCLWSAKDNSQIIWFSAKSNKVFYLDFNSNKRKVKICSEKNFKNKIKNVANVYEIDFNSSMESKINLRINDFEKVDKILPNYVKKGI